MNINASMTVHVRCAYTYKFYLLVLVVRGCMILERQELFGSGLKNRDVIGRLSSFKHMLKMSAHVVPAGKADGETRVKVVWADENKKAPRGPITDMLPNLQFKCEDG